EHTPDRDPVAQPGDARSQHADAARDRLDGRTRCGRRVERVDDLGVGERVYLEANPRRLAGGGSLRHALDLVEEPVAEEPRRDEELAEDRRAYVTGDGVEDVDDVGGDVLVGREEAQVLVSRRVRGMVVAAPDVHVAAQAAALAPDEERELRVDLDVRGA